MITCIVIHISMYSRSIHLVGFDSFILTNYQSNESLIFGQISENFCEFILDSLLGVLADKSLELQATKGDHVVIFAAASRSQNNLWLVRRCTLSCSGLVLDNLRVLRLQSRERHAC